MKIYQTSSKFQLVIKIIKSHLPQNKSENKKYIKTKKNISFEENFEKW